MIVATKPATLEDAIGSDSLHSSAQLRPGDLPGVALLQGVSLVVTQAPEDESHLPQGFLTTSGKKMGAPGTMKVCSAAYPVVDVRTAVQ